MENVGGGYNSASGKFMALLAGTYHFTVTVMNTANHHNAYMDLLRNGTKLCSALAAGMGAQYQTGVCRRVVRLRAGEEIWVVNPDWAETEVYHNYFTTLEGFLVHVKK